MKIITKLALVRITAKKARSAVICAAVFLTMVLFMTVVSISVNLIGSYELMMCLTAGTDFHGYLREDAFTLSADELRNKILKSDDVSEAVILSSVTQFSPQEHKKPESDDTLFAAENEGALSHFYTEITEGTFPASDSEILLNTLRFPDVQVGDTVTLYYVRHSETASAEFTVSGLMTSRGEREMPAILRYSSTLEETYGFGAVHMVYFMMENTINLAGKYDALIDETLASFWQGIPVRFGAVNTAYLEGSLRSALNPANVFLILFSVAVVFFCSFLLIYNIYSIALTQDMQAFGLLNVLGTTHGQMRKIILLQSAILFGITLPLGLTAGYFIGWKMLSPLMFVTALSEGGLEFRFSPWIPVLTAALSLFTLLWSASRPLKRIRALTPIGAVDYSPAADLPKRYVRRKNYIRKNTVPDTGRLAMYTVSRSRRKTVITALSMSLSVILFVLIATLCDYMLAYTERNMQYTDYVVKPEKTYRLVPTDENTVLWSDQEYVMSYDIDEGIGLSEEYVSAVENLEHTDRVWRVRTAVLEIPTPAHAVSDLREMKSISPEYAWSPVLQKALEGRMDVIAVGLPDAFFAKLKISDDEQIGETDNTAVYESFGLQFSCFRDGDTVRIGLKDYRIRTADHLPAYNITGYLNSMADRAILYLPESEFVKQCGEGVTYCLLIDGEEDGYEALREELETLSEHLTLSLDDEIYDANQILYAEWFSMREETTAVSADITGKYDDLETMRETVVSIRTVGYSLAGMIFLIGALNIVNTALSSAAERKREFAMLEAVGMTDRQMMKMILIESLYSGGAAALITVCVGFPLIAVIINTAMDALVTLNWLSGVIMLAVCIGVSVLSGAAVFRLTKSDAVVERIKVE